MLGAEDAPATLQRVLLEAPSALEVPKLVNGFSQVAHGGERVGVLLTQRSQIGLKGLLVKVSGSPEVPLFPERFGKVAQGAERVWMFVAEGAPARLYDLLL